MSSETPSAPESSEPTSTPAAESSVATNDPATSAEVADLPNASGENVSAAAAGNSDDSKSQAAETTTAAGGGLARGSGPLAARGLGIAKPASPTVSTEQLEAAAKGARGEGKGKPRGNKKSRSAPRPKLAGENRGPKPASPTREGGDAAEPAAEPSAVDADAAATDPPQAALPRVAKRQRVAVPNMRRALDDDLQAEMDAALGGGDIDALMGQAAGLATRKDPIADGTRVAAVVLKIQDDHVFVSLGGPDEGVVPFEQFETEPEIGSQVEVMVRGFSAEDSLYQCTLPGGAIEASDWDDLQEGTVVEATVTATNSGGLEAKVGGVKGFIPISQITEYRVEDTSEFVGQKFLCVVTEANQRRGNLVLSRRAILEREREEKRQAQLEQIEVGDLVEGTVRSLKDFGAFVDLGALDGLIHISKLSWDRIKHPGEVLEEGQKVKCKIEKLNKETGKISLSYRDTLENPWDAAEAQFAPGTIHQGTVTRVAPFGCFVRLAAGVEGLVHISELANHRVSKVDAFISEGDSAEVKVLTIDRDAQKIALSIKQAAKPSAAPVVSQDQDTPPPEVAIGPQHDGPLRGGNNRETGGERFGLRW